MTSLLDRNVNALIGDANQLALAKQLLSAEPRAIAPSTETAQPLRLPAQAEIVFLGAPEIDSVSPLLRSGNRRLTIVEPDPDWLARLLMSQDLTEPLVSKRLVIVSAPTQEALRLAWDRLTPTQSKLLLVDGAGSACSPERRDYFRAAQRIIESSERDRGLDTGATLVLARSAIANAFINIARGDDLVLSPGTGKFDTTRTRPALVVGAGPSLDAAHGTLRQLAPTHAIVAVDTAAPSLIREGVTPDFVIAVDPRARNTQHLDGLSLATSTLIREISSHPLLSAKTSAREAFFVSANPIGSAFAHLGWHRPTLQAFGSVSTAAFELACELGFGPVVFVGHDLAFSGSQEYAQATSPSASPGTDDDERCWEDDIHGHRIQTTQRLVCFRDWLERRIAARASVDPRQQFINASGCGILRRGVEQMPLADYAAVSAQSVRKPDDRPYLVPNMTRQDGMQTLERLSRHCRQLQQRLARDSSSTPEAAIQALQRRPALLSLAELIEARALIELRRDWENTAPKQRTRSLRHIFQRAIQSLSDLAREAATQSS